jgi:hypothetical protein
MQIFCGGFLFEVFGGNWIGLEKRALLESYYFLIGIRT